MFKGHYSINKKKINNCSNNRTVNSAQLMLFNSILLSKKVNFIAAYVCYSATHDHVQRT